jgi:hypothetical protein
LARLLAAGMIVLATTGCARGGDAPAVEDGPPAESSGSAGATATHSADGNDDGISGSVPSDAGRAETGRGASAGGALPGPADEPTAPDVDQSAAGGGVVDSATPGGGTPGGELAAGEDEAPRSSGNSVAVETSGGSTGTPAQPVVTAPNGGMIRPNHVVVVRPPSMGELAAADQRASSPMGGSAPQLAVPANSMPGGQPHAVAPEAPMP